MALADCAGGQVGVSGISHGPYDTLLLPVRMMSLFFPTLEGIKKKKRLDSYHQISDQLILRMHFAMLEKHGFLLQQVVVLMVSDLLDLGTL